MAETGWGINLAASPERKEGAMLPPGLSAKVVAIGIRRRHRPLVRGLAGGGDLRFWPPASPDIRPVPVPEGLVDAALRTAIRQPRGLASVLKKSVLKGQWNSYHRRLSRLDPAIVLCWNGSKGHRLLAMEAARKTGHRTLYLEDSPLPGRRTVDFRGINGAGSLPATGGFYHAWAERQGGADLSAWRSLRGSLVARPSSKRADVGQATGGPIGGPYVFAPLQVPGDSQLTLFGDWIPTVEDMVDALRAASAALPEGWHVRVKEHPSSSVACGALHRIAAMPGSRIVVDNLTETFTQVAGSRAVVTVNSSVGFQAFFWDRPVIHLGHAFWGVPGVAAKAGTRDGLAALLGEAESLSFDPALRDAFMSYCLRHFPAERDIVEGRFTIESVTARDAERESVMRDVAGD